MSEQPKQEAKSHVHLEPILCNFIRLGKQLTEYTGGISRNKQNLMIREGDLPKPAVLTERIKGYPREVLDKYLMQKFNEANGIPNGQ